MVAIGGFGGVVVLLIKSTAVALKGRAAGCGLVD
jgi:hypothetical protein